MLGYEFKEYVDRKEKIIAITPYCRTCNRKLKTKEGVASHKNQKHEVLMMKIQKPTPSLSHNQVILKQDEHNPFELIHYIDYSNESKTL